MISAVAIVLGILVLGLAIDYADGTHRGNSISGENMQVFFEITTESRSDFTGGTYDKVFLDFEFLDSMNPMEDVLYRIEIWKGGELLTRQVLFSEDSKSTIEIRPNPDCQEVNLWECVTSFETDSHHVFKGPIFSDDEPHTIIIDLEAQGTESENKSIYNTVFEFEPYIPYSFSGYVKATYDGEPLHKGNYFELYDSDSVEIWMEQDKLADVLIYRENMVIRGHVDLENMTANHEELEKFVNLYQVINSEDKVFFRENIPNYTRTVSDGPMYWPDTVTIEYPDWVYEAKIHYRELSKPYQNDLTKMDVIMEQEENFKQWLQCKGFHSIYGEVGTFCERLFNMPENFGKHYPIVIQLEKLD